MNAEKFQEYASPDALVTRVAQALRTGDPSVVFLLGSGVTASVVPSVASMNQLSKQHIESYLTGNNGRRVLAELRKELSEASSEMERYQIYQRYIRASDDTYAYDRVVQGAVLEAYGHFEPSQWRTASRVERGKIAEAADLDPANWLTTKGLDAFARMAATKPVGLDGRILTTNFDPLVEMAFRKLGVGVVVASLKTDGSLESFVTYDHPMVVHLHGYWRPRENERATLLHSPAELHQPRPELLASIARLLDSRTVVVVGYSGWDDVFLRALTEAPVGSRPQVCWGVFAESPEGAGPSVERVKSDLARRLRGGDLNNVTYYAPVNADTFFHELGQAIAEEPKPRTARRTARAQFALLGTADVKDTTFGPKIATLSSLKKFMPSVPDGVAISLGAWQRAPSNRQHALLCDAWKSLKALPHPDGPDGAYIVRSSASVEDDPNYLFAGRFETVDGVTSFEEFVDAATACMNSVESSSVNDYLEARTWGTRRPIRMAILAQVQIRAELGGVAFTKAPPPFDDIADQGLIELAHGPSKGILGGDSAPSVYSFVGSSGETFRHCAGPEADPRHLAPLLEALLPLLSIATGLLDEKDLDVEWVWDGRNAHLVQARAIPVAAPHAPTVRRAPAPAASRNRLSLPDSDRLGSKAAAQRYFQQVAAGAKNAVILEPGISEDEIARALGERETSAEGTVIRFSVGNEVGLPKSFVAAGGDVLANVLDGLDKINKDDGGAACIVSDFMYVENSFEAYVSEDSLIVEHIPSNWEADSKLPPDLFLWTSAGFEVHRVKVARSTEVEFPTDSGVPRRLTRAVEPIGDDVLKQWADRMVRQFRKIREDLRDALPLNIHFVGDLEGNWYFLNIRQTQPVEEWGSVLDADTDRQFKQNRFFTITAEEHVDEWDESSQILLNYASDRSDISSVARLGAKLIARGVRTVHCTFGVLSHPAIVLRELGITVVPIYEQHDRRPIQAESWHKASS